MIHIYVNGKELILKKDTTLSIELNNSLLSEAEIDGDISYGFTIPTHGNEESLGFPNLDAADYSSEMDCVLAVDGAITLTGKLVMQKTSRNELNAAIVITPYPDGFADKSLRQNDTSVINIFNYGWMIQNITPATYGLVHNQSFVLHKPLYKLFLEKSTEEDSDIKFAPFFNDIGYGDANEHFGRWNGQGKSKIVNRLFFDLNGKIVNSSDNPYFTRIFSEIHHLSENGDSYTEINQFCLCPQIRLCRVLEEWCRNAGYSMVNHLGDDLYNTFIQSTKAIDGTAAQYQDGMYNGTKSLTRWTQFVLSEAGWYDFDFRETASVIPALASIYFIAIETIATDNNTAEDVYNGECDNLLCLLKMESLYQRHDICKIYVPKDYAGIHLRMLVGGKIGSTWSFFNLSPNWASVSIRQLSRDDEQGGLNIYRRSFSIGELMPDVSNADFIKTCLEAFGLCYYVSHTKHVIEIVPFALIRDCKAIDLTDYVLVRETETSNPVDKKITVRLSPLTDESHDVSKRLDDVEKYPQGDNPEKYILEEQTNTLYRCNTIVSDSGVNGWVQKWEEHSGNPDWLERGKGSEDKHEPSVKIPHQRRISNASAPGNPSDPEQYPVASFTISSDLYNKGEDNSDIILMQYRGLKEWKIRGTYFCQECMLPVYKKEFALRAKKGRWYATGKTLGETYIMPALELASHKTLTYKLRIPKTRLQELDNLMRPSELPPAMQTRFIIINNVKTVPKRIVMQIENDNCPDVLCEIEAVRLY